MGKMVPIVEVEFEDGKSPAWGPGEGAVVFTSGGNGKYGRILHIMNLSDEGAPLFDGMLRAEPGGALFLPVDSKGRIGLQKRERPQTTLDAATWKQDFVEGRINLEVLGRESWELPRGFGEFNESGEQTAVREAEEETGMLVSEQCALGWFNDNTANAPHMTFYSYGKINENHGEPVEGDPFERMLTGVEYFTLEEIQDLIAEGTLYCNFTLSAIAAYMIQQITHPKHGPTLDKVQRALAP